MYPIDLLKVRNTLAELEGKHLHYKDTNAGDQPFAGRRVHGAVKRGLYNLQDGRLWIDVARCYKRYPWCRYVFITNISPHM